MTSTSSPPCRCGSAFKSAVLRLIKHDTMSPKVAAHASKPVLCVPLRNWQHHPALADLPLPRSQSKTMYVLGDVHGDAERMLNILERVGVAQRSHDTLARWTGKDSVLLLTGDMIDKGPTPLKVIESLMALQDQAMVQGGRVVPLFGNHEALFFSQPRNSKATQGLGFDRDLAKYGFLPERFAWGDDPRAEWMRNRPFGARVGPYFFSHAGGIQGLSFKELNSLLRKDCDLNGYGAPSLIGNDGILEARLWWKGSSSKAKKFADTMEVRHIIFGHDPFELGRSDAIHTQYDTYLVRIDCGMSRGIDYSHGSILKLQWDDDTETGTAVKANGKQKLLWSLPNTLPKQSLTNVTR